MRIIIFLLLIFIVSCTTPNVTIEKSFEIYTKSDIPDRDMATMEAKRQAYYLLSKTKGVNNVKFSYLKFETNDRLLFSSEVQFDDFEPKEVKTLDNGGAGTLYSVVRSNEEYQKLLELKAFKTEGKGRSIEEAFDTALKKAIPEFLDGNIEDYEKIAGTLTVISIQNMVTTANEVSFDIIFSLNLTEMGNLTPKEKGEFYCELAIGEIYKKQNPAAYQLIDKATYLDDKIDVCFYAKGLLKQNEGDAGRAIYFYEETLKLNPNKLKYHQALQKIYLLTEQKMKAYEVEATIIKKFNPDGTLIVRENAPVGSKINDVILPEIKSETFSNGLKVSKIIKNDLPIFQMTLGFNFGNVNSPEGKMGIVGIMLNMLQEGTKTKSSKEISEYIDANGLYYWVETYGDFCEINCASLTKNSDYCINLIDDLIKNPAFSEAEFKKAIEMEMETYNLKSARPDYLASKLLYMFIYDDHPYKYYDSTMKTITAIKLPDVTDFFKKYVNASNGHLIVSGNYTDETFNKIKTNFESWNITGEAITENKDNVKNANSDRESIYLIHREGAKATIKYANLTIPYSNNDFIPLYFSNEIFGSGASSRLFLNLREKEGLTYGIYSGLSEKKQTGLFVLTGEVRNEVTGKAVKSILSQIDAVKKDGFTAEEIENKKKSISGQFAISLEKLSAINDELLKVNFFGMKPDSISGFLTSVNILDAESVKNAFTKYIDSKKGIIVVVGDYKQILTQLKEFGEVMVLDGETLKPMQTK